MQKIDKGTKRDAVTPAISVAAEQKKVTRSQTTRQTYNRVKREQDNYKPRRSLYLRLRKERPPRKPQKKTNRATLTTKERARDKHIKHIAHAACVSKADTIVAIHECLPRLSQEATLKTKFDLRPDTTIVLCKGESLQPGCAP